jgi:hypothetical protein
MARQVLELKLLLEQYVYSCFVLQVIGEPGTSKRLFWIRGN